MQRNLEDLVALLQPDGIFNSQFSIFNSRQRKDHRAMCVWSEIKMGWGMGNFF
jgi:hypothetical protein